MRNMLRSPYASAGRLLRLGAMRGSFSPLSLFSAGEVGAWYDPSDFSTMFQGAAGTTPVTAVEQPVGLVLDKSRGLVLGAELVTNGDFSNGTTGWTIASTGTAVVTSGIIRITSVSGRGTASQTLPTVVGQQYRLDLGLISNGNAGASAAIVRITSNNSYSGTVIAAVGSASSNGLLFFTATTTSTYIWLAENTATASNYVEFGGLSVRSDSGNHASQSTAASRPVLKSTSKIDFDGTDDKLTCSTAGAGTTGFLFVAGINIDVTGAAQTVWSDTGTNTGYRVRINASNQLELAAGNGTAYTTVTTTETLSAGTNYVIAAWHDGTNLNVRIGSGAIVSQAFATATAGTAGFTIGMDNGAVSSQLNGKVFNAVYVKNFAGSIAAVNNAIAYVNGKLT